MSLKREVNFGYCKDEFIKPGEIDVPLEQFACWEFLGLKSTHLKVAKFEKHCFGDC